MKTPVWSVKKVQPRKDYTLLLTFADGSERIYDARQLLDIPICSELKNPAFFLRAEAKSGTVVWSDDVDVAPEHLYECSVPVKDASISE